MVNDETLGMSICSGDAVSARLSTLLPVTHMLFATDVDGIYTSDPHIDPEAHLVKELTFTEIEKTILLTESHNKDTTGGLQGKMKECTTLFNTSMFLEEIHVFNGLDSKNYHSALKNNEFPHTRIHK
jgi:isopentenyl phosphate kinase